MAKFRQMSDWCYHSVVVTMTDKKCPGCDTTIPLCSCGVWDCGFYAHLGSDCPSERGAAYRTQLQFGKEFGEALDQKDAEKLRAVKEKYPELFEQRINRLQMRHQK